MNCYMEKRGELKDDYSIFLLNEKIGDLSGKLRKYPFNEEEKYNYPITWTRLGNVLAEYEGYSEVCYGMHFNVFWQRLWYILSKDEREDIEQRGATADFLSYMALLILIYAPFSGIGWYLQLQNYKSPLGLFDSIYFIWILSFIGFLLVHRSIYNAAVDEHERYGGYIKALFDIHHSELLAILPNPTQMDIKKCLEYSENFEDYSQLKI